MATLGEQGFSSIDSSLARGAQISAGEYTKRRKSKKRTPKVSIKGDTVVIDGKGYSVAPSLQAGFIKSKTGGRGGSASLAISQAKATATRLAEIEKQRVATQRATELQSYQERRLQPDMIVTDRTMGSIDRYQDKYIESLKQDPSANLVVQKYSGVRIPYGQKDITWQEPMFGTVMQGYPSGTKEVSLIGEMRKGETIDPDIFKPTGVLERQRIEKISGAVISEEKEMAQKELSSAANKIQEKINSGEISLKRGKEALKNIEDNINERLNVKVTKKIEDKLTDPKTSKEFAEKLKRARTSREQFGKAFDPEIRKEAFKSKVESVADITAIGASTLVPAVGIGYYTGKGIYQASKGRKEDIRMATYSPSGELEVPRYPGLIPSEKTQAAGFSLLFGATAGFGQVTKIGSDITALRQTELAAKPWTTTSKTLFKRGDTTFLKVSGSKTIGSSSAEGTALFPVKIGKKGSFKILGGEGKVATRTVDFLKQGVYSQKESVIKSTTDFTLFGKGSISKGFFRDSGLKIPFETTKTYVTSGEGAVIPSRWSDVSIKSKDIVSKWSAFTKDSGSKIIKPVWEIKGTYQGDRLSQFVFGGLTKKEGKKVIYTSGELLKARLYPSTGRFTGVFKPQSVGETLIKSSKKSGLLSFKGGLKKSSKGFLEGLYDIPAAQLQKQVTKPVAKAVTKPTASTVGQQFAGTAFASAETFTKATVKTIVPQVVSLPLVSSVVAPTIKTKIKTKPLLDYKSKVTVKQDTGLFSITTSAIDTAQDSAVSQKPTTITKPVLESITRQPINTFLPSVRIKPMPPKPKPVFEISPTIPFGFGKTFIPAKKKKQQGYIPQAKTKTGKWKPLSKKPMHRSAALSRGARAVDNTVSAQFRIKKVKGNPLGPRGNYFSMNQNKFRPYKVKKGKKVKLHNHFIEKRKNRIDTPGEKMGLKLSKYTKKQRWLV